MRRWKLLCSVAAGTLSHRADGSNRYSRAGRYLAARPRYDPSTLLMLDGRLLWNGVSGCLRVTKPWRADGVTTVFSLHAVLLLFLFLPVSTSSSSSSLYRRVDTCLLFNNECIRSRDKRFSSVRDTPRCAKTERTNFVLLHRTIPTGEVKKSLSSFRHHVVSFLDVFSSDNEREIPR